MLLRAEGNRTEREAMLPIASVVIDAAIQIRKSNREFAIQRYSDALDLLPPIIVVETEEGELLLCDGFQRTAAHQRAGRTEIKAHIYPGTREDALERAALANLTHGEPLDPDERDEAVRRLHHLHPDASNRRLAEMCQNAVSYQTINRLLAADEVRKAVPYKWAERLSHAALSEVHSAPRETWAALVTAYDRRRWSRAQVEQAVHELVDAEVPQEHKDRLLAGNADPGAHLHAKPKPPVDTRVSADEGVGEPQGFTDSEEWGEEAPDNEADEGVSEWDREYVGDEPGWDPVGADVGERLVSVSPSVLVPVRIPSGRLRQRGNRTYHRESISVQSTFAISVTDEVLEGYGNPNDPDTKGWAMLCREVYRQLWSQRPGVWPPDGPQWGEEEGL